MSRFVWYVWPFPILESRLILPSITIPNRFTHLKLFDMYLIRDIIRHDYARDKAKHPLNKTQLKENQPQRPA